ncbi:MAG: hypothetical protein VX000_14610, partial [Myxococcota bacterium]|nr:hypothetical protein [Myxococcota bacterium]
RRASSVKSGGSRGAPVGADGAKLRRMSSTLGNDAIADKLGGAAQVRDDLLARILERLETISHVQGAERDAIRNQREWFREVAKGDPGYHSPDTGRWHESARLYMEAAKALGRGQLGRGAELLDKAEEAERAAHESLPEQVGEKLKQADGPAQDAPGGAGSFSATAVCPVRLTPVAIIHEAEKILSVSDALDKAEPLKRTKVWFAEYEEEEEEEADADD